MSEKRGERKPLPGTDAFAIYASQKWADFVGAKVVAAMDAIIARESEAYYRNAK